MNYSTTGAAIFSITMLFLLMLPAKENFKPLRKQQDSFPFSNYPMFSKKRDLTYELNYFVGYDEDNNRYTIPYQYVNTGGFNQIRRQVNKKCRRGETAELMKRVAKRIVKSKSAPYNKIYKVELVEGEYHLENYFLTSNKAPIREKVLDATIIERP